MIAQVSWGSLTGEKIAPGGSCFGFELLLGFRDRCALFLGDFGIVEIE